MAKLTGRYIKILQLQYIKYVLPADRYISAVPDDEQFGHKTNLRLNAKNTPDLQWNITDELHTGEYWSYP